MEESRKYELLFDPVDNERPTAFAPALALDRLRGFALCEWANSLMDGDSLLASSVSKSSA